MGFVVSPGQSLRSYSLPYPVEHLLTLRKQEKILIAHGNLIGFTREVGGCLYLMPCLQLPVSSLVDEVVLELTFDEVRLLMILQLTTDIAVDIL